jgi:hypothetical protein
LENTLLPEITLKALVEGVGHLGSASSDKKPSHTDPLGISVDVENDLVTCFVIRSAAEKVITDLNDSGRVSYFFGLMTHEAWNFKGQFLGEVELNEEDLSKSKKFRTSMLEMMGSMGLPEDAIKSMFGRVPDVGLQFKVDHIFKQTPGPEAGQELEF